MPGVPHVVAGLPQVTQVGGDAVPAGAAPVVAGGDQARVEVTVRNDGALPVFTPQVELTVPAGWTVRPLGQAPKLLASDHSATFAFTVTLPATAAPGSTALTATTSYNVIGTGRLRQETATAVVVAPAAPDGDVVLSHHTVDQRHQRVDEPDGRPERRRLVADQHARPGPPDRYRGRLALHGPLLPRRQVQPADRDRRHRRRGAQRRPGGRARRPSR